MTTLSTDNATRGKLKAAAAERGITIAEYLRLLADSHVDGQGVLTLPAVDATPSGIATVLSSVAATVKRLADAELAWERPAGAPTLAETADKLSALLPTWYTRACDGEVNAAFDGVQLHLVPRLKAWARVKLALRVITKGVALP